MATFEQTPEPDWAASRDAPVRAWRPMSQLATRRQRVPRSSFPCVDVHNHLGRWLNDGQWMFENADDLIAVLDQANVELLVNLDGMWGAELEASLERYDRVHPSRIMTFCWIDWARLADVGGVTELKESLNDSLRRGARGIKVWKNLGLQVRDSDGTLILPDDPRVVEVLGHAGDIGLPVLIHVSDPKAYFAPVDLHNERLAELLESPGMWVGDRDAYPGFDRLIDALAALVKATPNTRYVGAHVGCASEDLDRVEQILDDCPNFWIDIAGRISELGRQPRRFRRLVERFPDRIVFGTDLYPADQQRYEKYFHFVESDDEGFDYAPEEPYPPYCRWTISGLGLAPEYLAKIYSTNARRWLGLTTADLVAGEVSR